MSSVEDCILNLLVDSIVRKECFDVHFLLKSNQMTLEEVYNVRELPKSSSGSGLWIVDCKWIDNRPICILTDKSKLSSSGSGSLQTHLAPMTVICPVCSTQVGGQRFAPHLERCMNGGKRIRPPTLSGASKKSTAEVLALGSAAGSAWEPTI